MIYAKVRNSNTIYSTYLTHFILAYSSLFEADIDNDEVTVRVTGSLTLPAGISHLALELRAGTARAVLVLDVSQSGKIT